MELNLEIRWKGDGLEHFREYDGYVEFPNNLNISGGTNARNRKKRTLFRVIRMKKRNIW